jgi:Ser/Thr protein kinase RdoA (MazF antagonist)
VGWARPDRIVVLEPLRGRAWTQLPIEVQPNSMRHFGAALAKIHSLPTDVCPGPFQRYRVERVAHSADLVATARPDVADAIHELGDKLADGPGASGATVNIYGDLHTNNVLFHGNEVHMIDFDQGGSGAASADIGSLLASLMTTQLISPDVPADGLGAAFLDGYGAVRKLPSNTELKWYTTAAFLVEGAIRAVNRVDRPALAVLPEMLDIAEAVYDGKLSVDA